MPSIFNKLNAIINLQPIIMLSHMRANTSLFGHILGDNPEINGYYEMHMGYYSWKSFVRQRLKYLDKHSFKPRSKYIFDKVLHSEHYVNCDLFLNNNVKVIISLREPAETIPSILKLYAKVDSAHEFSTIEGAVAYYSQRLDALQNYSENLKDNFVYLDANHIKRETEKTFAFLEKELNLNAPLSTSYKLKSMTGKGSSGDHSSSLKKGQIIYEKNDYSDIEISNDIMSQLTSSYQDVRKVIIENSKSYLS